MERERQSKICGKQTDGCRAGKYKRFMKSLLRDIFWGFNIFGLTPSAEYLFLVSVRLVYEACLTYHGIGRVRVKIPGNYRFQVKMSHCVDKKCARQMLHLRAVHSAWRCALHETTNGIFGTGKKDLLFASLDFTRDVIAK